MELEFNEQILPSKKRIKSSIINFIDLRLCTILKPKEYISWHIGEYSD